MSCPGSRHPPVAHARVARTEWFIGRNAIGLSTVLAARCVWTVGQTIRFGTIGENKNLRKYVQTNQQTTSSLQE